MSRCFQKGFVLGEVLLSAFLSVGVLLLALRYWRLWTTEVDSVLYRLHVLQRASLLPHVLETRWKAGACAHEYSSLRVLAPQVYYHEWSQGLFPKSTVLMYSKCGFHQFYFLASSKSHQGLSLYEKTSAHRAEVVINDLLFFSCQPDLETTSDSVSCTYGFAWPTANGHADEKSFRVKVSKG